MQKSILMCAVATAALTFAMHQPVLAKQSGSASTIAENGEYYIGADGVIRQRGDTVSETTQAVGGVLESAPLPPPQPVVHTAPGRATMAPIEDVPSERAEPIMAEPLTTDVVADGFSSQPPIEAFAAPIPGGDIVETQTLSETYAEPVSDVMLQDAAAPVEIPGVPMQTIGGGFIEEYASPAPAPAMDYGVGGNYVTMDSPTIETMPAPEPIIEAAPVITPTPVMDSYEFSAPAAIIEPAPVIQAAPIIESAPVFESAPAIEHGILGDSLPMSTGYAGTDAYLDTPPVVVAHNDVDMGYELPSYVDGDLGSGADYAARGDGAYGPAIFKRPGEGPAGAQETIFIGKSTIVKLPVEAREVIVADPSVVRAVLRKANEVLLFGLMAGATNVTFLDEDGNQILNLDVSAGFDLSGLRTALADSFPDTELRVDDIHGDVVITGAASSPAKADDIRKLVKRYIFSARKAAGEKVKIKEVEFIDRISLSLEEQVLVKVQVAEMRRNAVKQFGVNFNLASDGAIAALTAGGSAALETTVGIRNPFAVNGSDLGGIAANIAGSFDGAHFGGLVNAFEQHNVIRVLAEPTLTAVSGERASFLAGGEFPYPSSIDDGRIGYTYRDFGVALEFTPVVLDSGRISLQVSTEVSELTNEGSLNIGDITIPGLATRRANTTVELPSGGTMAIAGMLMQRDSASHTGLPGLKNLPVVGQLLSSTDYMKRESELVILVTPYLAKPRHERDFRLPTDGFAPASDFDLYVMGRIHKVYGRGDETLTAARRALKSPFGFIIE